MKKEDLPKIDLPTNLSKISLSDLQINKTSNSSYSLYKSITSSEKTMKILASEISEQNAKDRANLYQQTELMREIRDEITRITDVMEILRINSNHQSEIMEIVADILLLSESKNQSEAANKFDTILDKIKRFKDNIELYNFLDEMLKTGYRYIKMKIKGEL